MKGFSANFPSCYILQKGEESQKIALSLTTAAHKFAIRFTGGCGYMSVADANGLYSLFTNALYGFSGAILFGGTRMLSRHDNDEVVHSITEIPPLIKASEPNVVLLGVVPRTSELQVHSAGLVVSDEPEDAYFTIIHPDQDMSMLVQRSVDQPASWTDEYEECMNITQSLRDFAGWQSLLISYNGGGVTEKEILATAKNGWPVLLIKGSGRKSDEYASNEEFLANHPNVMVAEKNAESIRQKLRLVGALSAETRPSLRAIT